MMIYDGMGGRKLAGFLADYLRKHGYPETRRADCFGTAYQIAIRFTHCAAGENFERIRSLIREGELEFHARPRRETGRANTGKSVIA